jgi:hypothetical protein
MLTERSAQPNKITVIFRRKLTKHYRRKLQAVIEEIDLPNPGIRSQETDVRDRLLLGTEPASNIVNEQQSNRESSPITREHVFGHRQLLFSRTSWKPSSTRTVTGSSIQPTILPNGQRIPG